MICPHPAGIPTRKFGGTLSFLPIAVSTKRRGIKPHPFTCSCPSVTSTKDISKSLPRTPRCCSCWSYELERSERYSACVLFLGWPATLRRHVRCGPVGSGAADFTTPRSPMSFLAPVRSTKYFVCNVHSKRMRIRR